MQLIQVGLGLGPMAVFDFDERGDHAGAERERQRSFLAAGDVRPIGPREIANARVVT